MIEIVIDSTLGYLTPLEEGACAGNATGVQGFIKEAIPEVAIYCQCYSVKLLYDAWFSHTAE